MKKVKFISKTMGVALTMANVLAVTPVYAANDSGFTFPVVSMAPKTEPVKVEVKSRAVIREDAENLPKDSVEAKKLETKKAVLDKKKVEQLIEEKIENIPETTEQEANFEVDAVDTEKVESSTVIEETTSMEEVPANEEVIVVEEITVEASATLEETVEEVVERPSVEIISNICEVFHVKNIENCDIYEYPDKELGEVVDTAHNRARIFVIGETVNDFYHVSYNEQEGFIEKANLEKILDEDFQNSDIYSVFLNKTANILSIEDTSSGNFYLEKDVPLNTELVVVGYHNSGYYKVQRGENFGYIAENNCSLEKLQPQTSEMQKLIAKNAADNNSGIPCESGYCAAWVAGVYSKSGATPSGENYCDAIDFWHRWGIDDGVTSSTRSDNIPVGATVVGSGGGSPLGNLYGHVGIYIGDGYVVDNVGRHRVSTLEDWIAYNDGICDGYQGYIGWVFPFNIDWQDYPEAEPEITVETE